MKLGILGGGLSGLSLAHFYGADCEVLEKDDVCGGLCRTVTVTGPRFGAWSRRCLASCPSTTESERGFTGTGRAGGLALTGGLGLAGVGMAHPLQVDRGRAAHAVTQVGGADDRAADLPPLDPGLVGGAG